MRGWLIRHAEMIVAAAALLFALGAVVDVRGHAACQAALNEVVAAESEATTQLMDVIFTSDQLEQQLAGYASYLDAIAEVKRRRAALHCG